ncbi:CD209 antigen-like protein A isoform X4 [Poecilia reticulata]|uniref:CD209 antigen-like protein A n=1 Tax=Poecilia reticulata TaxID=8081 RepID=A0A3P9N9E1_POERE|nr:PREDICTED: CD209 antigen-like protein A isoform X4 [Poecilia reticulata]
MAAIDRISVEHEEPASAAKSPGRIIFSLLLLMFGFLCILQSVLNVSLRLTSWPSSFKQQLATFCPSIYYISSARATWGDSRNDCLNRGADLVIINSREEQDFLTWFKKRLWIGLTDAEKEAGWKWVDGTRLTTSYWGHDEPNSDLGTNEDCGEMRFYESENNWNDVPCDMENSWICERKLQG